MCIFSFNFFMFGLWEKSILRKHTVLHFEKFPSLLLPGNAAMLQHLIIQIFALSKRNGRLREVKKELISLFKIFLKY